MFVRAAITVALILLGTAPAALASTTSGTPGTLTVSGQGTVMAVPDQANLSVTVNRSAATTASALSAANRSVDAIVAASRSLGVPATQIQTESVNTACGRVRVGPKRHRREIRRCTASESLSITGTPAQAGRVIDAATHAGASAINGPNFSFSNPAALVIAAESAAITNAQAQANVAAAQLGDTVTGVQSVALNPQSGVLSTPGSAAAAAPSASVPTTLSPGAQAVSATVTVVFTIAPASPS
ncbi:SIMPL domain-containing protein [Conexibacter sp. DBS9H8]|uniref:SIMPL domain-containing protein n=1 Tax=Conexibacter sp. DBS9H8 TaxID=2937801 RepID=UPI00200E141A|nr:SIMPL domain-containing protein [Conexibacter sp. DBS9H8]